MRYINGNLIKFKNKYCHCNKKVVVRISESEDNSNKLYYCCRYDVCRCFRFWYPTDADFEGGLWFDLMGMHKDESKLVLHTLEEL